ncbi:MAG: acyl-CoA dehydrogenase [Desulfobacterales bacterium]|nr:MAG: acyl-CoA dehydrogenase [Desulfobacterales bacterium]
MVANNADTPLRGLDDESRQMVVDTVRQLRRRLLTRDKILEWDREEVFPEEAVRELVGPELGLQLLFLPEEYGGMGGGARDCCRFTREMARICLGVGTAFFAIHLGADPILVGATHEQKKKWLGKIAEGDTLVAYAVTEANAGSNLASLKTRAEPIEEDGKITAYKLNGAKQFISTGGYADFITVLAATPDGPTFFIVEKGQAGYEQGKGEEKHGIRASNTSPLTFTDVIVPVENLIGGVPGQGLKQANKVFGYTRLMVASMAAGCGDAALRIAIPYAQERIQFGAPLSEKQGYTHKLIIPHVVKMAAGDAYMDEIATRIDGGGLDMQVEGAIAKYFVTEAVDDAANDCIQALGGYGYISEYEVEKIKRDVKITCIYEGTSEIQQNIIATFRWRTTRKTKGAYYGDMAAEMAELAGGMDDIGARYYGLAARALNVLIEKVHEARLTKQQYIMFALSDLMTHVEVGVSMGRKTAFLVNGGDKQAEKYKAMSRIFANMVSEITVNTALTILSGSGAFEEKALSEFMYETTADRLSGSYAGVVRDMDFVADIVFGRIEE